MRFKIFHILILSISFFTTYSQGNGGKSISTENRPLKFIDNIILKPGSVENSLIGKSLIKSNPNLFHDIADDYKDEDALIEKSNSLQFKFALLLDTTVEYVGNSKLIGFIDDWLNTRYHLGGNSKNGIDCSGFSGLLMDSVYQIELPRTARGQYKNCRKVDKEDLEIGNLVFFNTRGGVSHVGVYLMNGFFVHSSTNKGVMISNIEEDYYRKRFISGGIPNIENDETIQ